MAEKRNQIVVRPDQTNHEESSYNGKIFLHVFHGLFEHGFALELVALEAVTAVEGHLAVVGAAKRAAEDPLAGRVDALRIAVIVTILVTELQFL